jgi:hypothetical protein
VVEHDRITGVGHAIAVARALGFVPFALDLAITSKTPARGLW